MQRTITLVMDDETIEMLRSALNAAMEACSEERESIADYAQPGEEDETREALHQKECEEGAMAHLLQRIVDGGGTISGTDWTPPTEVEDDEPAFLDEPEERDSRGE